MSDICIHAYWKRIGENRAQRAQPTLTAAGSVIPRTDPEMTLKDETSRRALPLACP